MKVGFIGLGTMGAYMAANLSRYLESSNHGFVVHDIRRESAEPFLAKGAAWADSPRQLAENCDVVFLSLPGPKEVEAVATAADTGLLGGLKKGARRLRSVDQRAEHGAQARRPVCRARAATSSTRR